MIKYLYVNNYKSFVNFRIDFDRSNLLIGCNGAGKSNVFVVIASIRDIVMGDRNVITNTFNPVTITRWMKSNIQTFELCVSDKEYEYVYRLEIEHDLEAMASRISTEKLTKNGMILYQMLGGVAEVYDNEGASSKALVDPAASGIAFVPSTRNYTNVTEFRNQISRILICNPNPRTMSDAVQNDVYIPRVDFSNIAGTYAGVILLEPDIVNELMETYRETVKGFVKARIHVDVTSNIKRLMMEFKYKDVSCSYFFGELSDGEKMLFALYTLLYGYIKRGMTVLLDEPDNYVSLREIQPWCVNVERELGENGQCIIVSHHPEIIDYMAETDGIWMTRLSSGESKIVDKPDIGKNEELFSYSEMITRGLLDET